MKKAKNIARKVSSLRAVVLQSVWVERHSSEVRREHIGDGALRGGIRPRSPHPNLHTITSHSLLVP